VLFKIIKQKKVYLASGLLFLIIEYSFLTHNYNMTIAF